jgi:hypothetical protein
MIGQSSTMAFRQFTNHDVARTRCSALCRPINGPRMPKARTGRLSRPGDSLAGSPMHIAAWQRCVRPEVA